MKAASTVWADFCANFAGVSEEAAMLLSQPDVVRLGERLVSLGPWVHKQLHGANDDIRSGVCSGNAGCGDSEGGAAAAECVKGDRREGGGFNGALGDTWMTLVHGDAKAMNMFLRRCAPSTDANDDCSGDDTSAIDGCEATGANTGRCNYSGRARGAVLIDFQWTGVGLGMLDVAMHLYHSVSVAAMADGGEEHLLRHYYAALASRIGPEAAARYALVRRVSQLTLWPQE
jgi:hypothetical protein